MDGVTRSRLPTRPSQMRHLWPRNNIWRK
jgi:hypothetical protein